MHARVPQDVDLEDRLLFGLTAVRFGQVAVACLAAVAAWRLVPWVGGALAVVLVALGAAAGWGSWRGRGLDHWAVAIARYLLRTRRIEVDSARLQARLGRVRAAPLAARPLPARTSGSALRVLDGGAE